MAMTTTAINGRVIMRPMTQSGSRWPRKNVKRVGAIPGGTPVSVPSSTVSSSTTHSTGLQTQEIPAPGDLLRSQG